MKISLKPLSRFRGPLLPPLLDRALELLRNARWSPLGLGRRGDNYAVSYGRFLKKQSTYLGLQAHVDGGVLSHLSRVFRRKSTCIGISKLWLELPPVPVTPFTRTCASTVKSVQSGPLLSFARVDELAVGVGDRVGSAQHEVSSGEAHPRPFATLPSTLPRG